MRLFFFASFPFGYAFIKNENTAGSILDNEVKGVLISPRLTIRSPAASKVQNKGQILATNPDS